MELDLKGRTALITGSSRGIGFDLIGMMPTIEFYNQSGIKAAKICHRVADGNLPPEFMPGHPATSQLEPELILSGG